MSNPYQNPNYQYQTPNPNPPQQPGQYIQPGQFTQPGQPLPNTYNDPGQQAYPYYTEGSQPSRQRHSSRSPNARNIPFPEPHYGGSASNQQAYIPPPQTTPNLTVPPTHHPHGRRGSPGHSPVTGSSNSQQLYPAGAGLDTVGGFYPPQPGVQPPRGENYTTTATQPQDWNTVYDGGQGSRPKAPPNRPAAGEFRTLCRYPRCNYPVFLDTRVNEYREWCSDQHMQQAILHRVEKPCNTCRAWPRRNGYKLCSGNSCRYPRY